MSGANHIAIVGMAARFPRSPDVSTFWKNLREGVECTRQFSEAELLAAGVSAEEIADPHYVRSGAVLEDMEGFDAGFFGFSPRDAAIMDPQHRHFLEVSWEALEHAGYDPARYDGNVGVFGGSGHNAYLPYNLLTNPELMESVGFFLVRHTGNDKDFLTTRVSYAFDLRGPSVAVQTACSTSLVAVHLACQSLLSGECDMALAGGVTIEMPHYRGYRYEEGEILSPDGHCRAFDHRSEGTIFSSGVGIVVLKRLDDAIAAGDTIHAVILGSAINNDGSNKVGYLAPSVDGQAAAIAEALALADVDASTIGYVEAHGTGTPVGDPIEVAALTRAFRESTDEKGYCGLGSVKSNLGHTDNAAGVANLLKVVTALEHEELPPTIHYEAPNPSIDFASSPFYVQAKLTPWKRAAGKPRRAGVNSLGVGGTNAFVIVEEAPEPGPSQPGRSKEVLLLSARSPAAADRAVERLGAALAEQPSLALADVAHTLQVGRRAFAHRRALVAGSTLEAAQLCASRDPGRVFAQLAPEQAQKLVYMFPGGGAQYADMGRELYEKEPVYRAELDRCLEILKPRTGDLRPLLFPAAGEREAASKQLERPSLSLPTLFATEWALAKLWMSWGAPPVSMIGHSMGEYTAACLAGVFSLEDALALVTVRGQLFEKVEPSGMLSVPLSAAELEPLLGSELSIAAINGSSLTVASGPNAAIEELAKRLEAREVDAQRVHIAIAAHSKMLDPILPEFGRFTRTIRYAEPKLPFASNVTGKLITAREATDPDYWVRHLRGTVRFLDGLDTIFAEPNRALLEVGPGRTLSTFGRARATELGKQTTSLSSLRHVKEEIGDLEYLSTVYAKLWLGGVELDFAAYREGQERRRVPLPTYPFEHQRHWIEPGKRDAAKAKPSLAKKPDLADWFYFPRFERQPHLRGAPRPRSILLVGGGAFAEALAASLRTEGHTLTVALSGQGLEQTTAELFRVDLGSAADHERLIAELAAQGRSPDVLIFAAGTEGVSDGGFAALLALGQALGRLELSKALELVVLTSSAAQVAGEAVAHPEQAMLGAASKVLAQEIPRLSVRSVDAVIDASTPARIAELGRALSAEIEAASEDRVVALRGHERFVQRYEPLALGQASEGLSRLRDGGVYLVTGGLGGIGLVLAEHLAKRHQAKLVLVGRRALPEGEARHAWLESHDVDDPVSEKLRRIQEMERLGAEILVASADVTDAEAMSKLVAEARARFGAVHGVFHTAGVLDDGVVALETLEAAKKVLAPKVEGARALDHALEGLELDFVVYFSSVSAITGLAGQFDYAAANAYLDAHAEARTARTGQPSYAVAWNAWRDVGMAASLASELGVAKPAPRPPAGHPTCHPWLDRAIFDTEQRKVYASLFSRATHWVLGEHVLRSGEAVIPGTGFLELLRGAFVEAEAENGEPSPVPCEITGVEFLAPFGVGANEQRELRIELTRQSDGAWLAVLSGGSAPERLEHTRATLRRLVDPAPPAISIDTLRARCKASRREQFPLAEERFVAFGPRWDNRVRAELGEREALLELSLPEAHRSDVDVYALHPALLDFATAGVQEIVPGFDPKAHFYVPLSYGRLRLHRPLTARLYSHVELVQGSSATETVSFAVHVYDESGELLVDINDFSMRKLVGHSLDASAARAPRARSTANKILELGLEAGIGADEGMEAIERLLAGPVLPHVVVSSQDLSALLARTRPQTADESSAASEAQVVGVRTPRPPLSTAYVAPATELEKTIASVWEELLGVQGIGLHDDFFDLGGHSLLLTQLVSRVRKQTAAEISLKSLFEKRTVAAIAEQIEASKRSGAPAAPTLKRVSREGFKVSKSALGPSPQGGGGSSDKEG